MRRLLLCGVLIAVLAACAPQHRMARLLRRHPWLAQQADTVVLRDTFAWPYAAIDTVFVLPAPPSPETSGKSTAVTVQTGRVRASIWRLHSTKTDSVPVALTLEQLPDTVVHTHTATVPKITLQPTAIPPVKRYVRIVVGAGLVLLIFLIMKQIINQS